MLRRALSFSTWSLRQTRASLVSPPESALIGVYLVVNKTGKLRLWRFCFGITSRNMASCDLKDGTKECPSDSKEVSKDSENKGTNDSKKVSKEPGNTGSSDSKEVSKGSGNTGSSDSGNMAPKEEIKGSEKQEPSASKVGAADSDAKDGAKESHAASYVTRRNLRRTQEEEVQKIKDEFLALPLKEKRKLYKCRDKYTTLGMVETWPEYYEKYLAEDQINEKWWSKNKGKVEFDVKIDLNDTISLFGGDITTLEIDSIANAANESLLGGGGVDGAIHAAAGRKALLRKECELLGGCRAGDAKITCGYNLPARYVVHTVGPRGERPETLASCYKKSLDLLKENNLRAIAFPCISTGIFGYPNLNAAKVALRTIREWLEKEDYAKNIDRIIMCLFLQKDIDIYHEQMQLYFPLDRGSSE